MIITLLQPPQHKAPADSAGAQRVEKPNYADASKAPSDEGAVAAGD